MKIIEKYTCPCCGYKVFNEGPGSFEICPICYWEDEAMQLRYPKEVGANKVSLIEAQENYEKHGVSDLGLKNLVRKPKEDDEKDPLWRKIDLKKDTVVEKREGLESTHIYPLDTTRLYYWSENYLDKE